MLEFRILGPLEVVDDGRPVTLGGPRQRATLAILLLDANRVVSIDRIADDLYAGAAPVTAVAQVQRQISELRKALGPSAVIETRSPGYVVRVEPEQLDLDRFERLSDAAARALRRGETEEAVTLLDEALTLWRGTPLADLANEPFARAPAERLDEIRLAALERRLEAKLRLGQHAAVVAELEGLVARHPLNERFRAQLMLALYRAGRQAEALERYREGRLVLVEELGLEPTPMLRELERAILDQDASLDVDHGRANIAAPDRAILVLPSTDTRIEMLLAVAQPLGRPPERELIVVRLVTDESEVEGSVERLQARLKSISVSSRTAAFTTADPFADLLRLASVHPVDLVLLDAPSDIGASPLSDFLAAVLERSPVDVGILSGSISAGEWERGLFVPFGGGDSDWAALELAALFAAAVSAPLHLVGTRADPGLGRRDASRLLADAALAVQSVVGVQTRAVLADASDAGLMESVASADLVVVGISPRWRRDGIGATRRALVRDTDTPVLLVHRGLRPGGLAPPESATRFSWSVRPV